MRARCPGAGRWCPRALRPGLVALLVLAGVCFIPDVRTQMNVPQGTFRTVGYWANWAVVDGMLHVDMGASTTGWVGFGYKATANSPGHFVTDMIVGKVINGTPYAEDYWSTALATPVLDFRTDVVLRGGEEVDGQTSIFFSKPVSAHQDTQDVGLPNGNVLVQWAYGASDTFLQHYGSARGAFIGNLRAGEVFTPDGGTPLGRITAGSLTSSCKGGSTGEFQVDMEQGRPPYRIDNLRMSATGTSFLARCSGMRCSGLPAGSYTVYTVDFKGLLSNPFEGGNVVVIREQDAVLAASAQYTCDKLTISVTGGYAPYAVSGVSGCNSFGNCSSFLCDGIPHSAGNPLNCRAVGCSGSCAASGMAAGFTQTVTIKDRIGCTASLNITKPGVSAVTQPSCSGDGRAVVSVRGMKPPFRIDGISGCSSFGACNATGACSGSCAISGLTASSSRSFTVYDALSCKGVTPTITMPAAIRARADVIQNVSCSGGNNGQIVVTVDGGTPPYRIDGISGCSSFGACDAAGVCNGSCTVSGLTVSSRSFTVYDALSCQLTTNSVTITQPAAVAATAAVLRHVACQGGSNGQANVSVTGGTPPYQVDGISGCSRFGACDAAGVCLGNCLVSGLTASTRSFTVYDALTCKRTTDSVTITQPAALAATAAVLRHVACHGGSSGQAKVSVTGGTPPYQIDGISGCSSFGACNATGAACRGSCVVNNLPAVSSRTFTIRDAKGCTRATAPITITQPAAPLSANAKRLISVSCSAGVAYGQVNIIVGGGTAPYRVLQYDIITNVQSDVCAGKWSGTTCVLTGLRYVTYTIVDSKSCTITVKACTG